MLSRGLDYDMLKQQNFQLKNEITDLKNGFDLNRDVLKILEDQIREKNPKIHLFYQVISRLTGINNQVMLNNMDLLIEKNKILAEKRRLETALDQVIQRNKQLLKTPYEFPSPKQIQMQLSQQIKSLRKQIFVLNEEKIHMGIQISELNQIIKEKEQEQLKKPLIPSTTITEKEQVKRKKSFQSGKKFQKKGQLFYEALYVSLKKQNQSLKRLVEELEYRMTLMANIYQIQPINNRKERSREMEEEDGSRKIMQNQLNLLMFALNQTQLASDEETDNLKITITKRMKFNQDEQQPKKPERTKSCPHKMTLDRLL